jgi:hypothetical protein
MLVMLLFAMLAGATPIDPGLTPPGLDNRAPIRLEQPRPQVAELPAIRVPDPGNDDR